MVADATSQQKPENDTEPIRLGRDHRNLQDGVESLISDVNADGYNAGFINLKHDEGRTPHETLAQLGKRDSNVKALAGELARSGYYSYYTNGYETRLVHETRIAEVWKPLRSGEYSLSQEGVVYKYTEPLAGEAPSRLLVVFSSISAPSYSSSLKRFFLQTFLNIQRYLPPYVGVLRIADVGGMLGAYYLDTAYRPDNAARVSRFINQQIRALGIQRSQVVFYGSSKGGTGAVFHGLTNDLKFVAVDPVIDDTYTQSERGDPYYTKSGIYLHEKRALFEELFEKTKNPKHPRNGSVLSNGSSVITSQNSPYFPYLQQGMMDILGSDMSFFVSARGDIGGHAEIGSKTINILTMLLNSYFYDLDVQPGTFHLDGVGSISKI